MDSKDIQDLIDMAAQPLLSEVPPHSPDWLQGSVITGLYWPQRLEGADGDLVNGGDVHCAQSFAAAIARLGGTFVHANPHLDERIDDVLRSTLDPNTPSEIIIVRHPSAGVPHQVSELLPTICNGVGIINSLDGSNEAPADALAFLAYLKGRLGELEGMNILLLGDYRFHPLGRSVLFALGSLSVSIHAYVPTTMRWIEPEGESDKIKYHDNCSTIPNDLDIILYMNPADEILNTEGPSRRDFENFFSFQRIAQLKPELSDTPLINLETYNEEEVAEFTVDPGVAARIAMLRWCFGK